MSSKNKDKGTYVENQIVKKHNEAGIEAHRNPLSGADKRFPHDISIGSLGDPDYYGEAKSRKGGAGFRMIRKWLGEADFLFLHENYTEPLVTMKFETYVKLLKRSNKDV